MSEIVLTDAQPVAPQHRRCPRCKAKPERRTQGGGFGGPQYPICRDCGYEFMDESTEGPCATA